MRRFIWITLIGILLAPGAALAQDEVVYFHTDAIGSVRVVTDATGAVIARYDYLPFGEPWNPPQNPDSRRFAGKELDAETGLDYFGARHYRAQSGRFTTIDPVMSVEAALTDPQRWNRYAYALNNPLKFTDPDGRNPVALLHRLAELAQRVESSPTVQRAQQVVATQGARAWVALTNFFLSPSGQELTQAAAELITGADAGPVSAVPVNVGAIIGHHSAGYVGVARELGVAVNDLGDFFQQLSKSQQDAALKSFLDSIISKGLNVLVVTEDGVVRRFSPLDWEVNYLRAKGYKYAEDGRTLLAPVK